MNKELVISRQLANNILSHAQKSPDKEVCGLVARDNADSSKMQFYPVANAASEPQNRYQMDAGEQIEVFRRIRESGQTLLGIMHSHPGARAIPSDIDMEQLEYDDVYYFIVSLNTRGVLELRCFMPDAGQQISMQEVDLLLEHE